MMTGLKCRHSKSINANEFLNVLFNTVQSQTSLNTTDPNDFLMPRASHLSRDWPFNNARKNGHRIGGRSVFKFSSISRSF